VAILPIYVLSRAEPPSTSIHATRPDLGSLEAALSGSGSWAWSEKIQKSTQIEVAYLSIFYFLFCYRSYIVLYMARAKRLFFFLD